jgi:multidrug efflux system outer membrane protein
MPATAPARPRRWRSLGRGAAVVALLALPGCMMGPDYKRPEVNAPAGFRDAPPTDSGNATTGNATTGNLTTGNATGGNVTGGNTTGGNVTGGNATAGNTTVNPLTVADLSWWQLYNDPVLQQLLVEALTNNYDVRIAATRVEQAHEFVLEQRSALFPQVTYGGTVSRGRNQVLGQLQPGQPAGSYNSSTSLQVGLSWELDLWGKYRRLTEAAKAEYLATVEGQRGVWLSLVSDVATTYFQLVALDAQLEVAENATKTYTETLQLFQERLEGGVASLLDTSSAAGALGAAAAQVPDLKRQIAETENLLSVLLGRNPGPIPRGILLTEQSFPPQVPPGLPSQLLERRPDILEAEQQVRAANAQIGVAKANFFPQLSLSGVLGKVSPEVAAFTGGAANGWSVAAGLAGPIFEGGLLSAQYAGAKAAWRESVLQYESTVLNALDEVADALVDRQRLAEVRTQQEYSVSAYSQAVDVSMKRYVAGKASYYEVLDAQTKLFPNETNLVNTRLNELLAVVDLYKALGGGWSQKGEDFLKGPPGGTGNTTGAPAANSSAAVTGVMVLAPPNTYNTKPVMLGPNEGSVPKSYFQPPTQTPGNTTIPSGYLLPTAGNTTVTGNTTQ